MYKVAFPFYFYVEQNIKLKHVLTGAFLSMGLMTNFLSLNEMFLISLQGKPILGVNLQKKKIEQLMNVSKLHLSVLKNFYGMLFTKFKVKYSPLTCPLCHTHSDPVHQLLVKVLCLSCF